MVKLPNGLGEYVGSDATGLTAVPGVWVAGDVADPVGGVAAAASIGVRAAAAINADLVADDTRLAVSAYREGSRLASAP